MSQLNVKVSVTLDEDIIDIIKKLSVRDGRSFSQYINLVLRRYIEYLSDEKFFK